MKDFIKKHFFTKIKNQIGFSLLEILVAIGLFAILVSISFVSYRAVTKGMELKTLLRVSRIVPDCFQ